jgi:hypothetical protein
VRRSLRARSTNTAISDQSSRPGRHPRRRRALGARAVAPRLGLRVRFKRAWPSSGSTRPQRTTTTSAEPRRIRCSFGSEEQASVRRVGRRPKHGLGRRRTRPCNQRGAGRQPCARAVAAADPEYRRRPTSSGTSRRSRNLHSGRTYRPLPLTASRLADTTLPTTSARLTLVPACWCSWPATVQSDGSHPGRAGVPADKPIRRSRVRRAAERTRQPDRSSP